MNDRTMNLRMRRAVVRCLILSATSALAQTAHAQETADAKPATVPAPDAAAGGDIVVTALKWSDSLQKTAAAVSVISGDEIVSRQMTDIRTLGTFVPSVKTNVDRTATQFFVRGVGKQVDQARIPESVGLVVDGVNIAQYASGLALFDVRAIEVLPGPQGTLYGSSSIGGVVNISTNRPTSKAETSLLIEAGNYGTVHATAIQNVPLTENLRIRFAYNGFYHDGYNSNGTFNDNMTAFRLTGLTLPRRMFPYF